MALIIKRGSVPATPHTEFYAKEGVLALEEIHGSYGFSGPWSRKLHIRSYPTEQVTPPKKADFSFPLDEPKSAEILQPYLIQTGDMPYEGDPLRGRKPIVFGSSTISSICKPVKSMKDDEFFRNGERHEIYFVQEGEGTLRTEYGNIEFRKNLYLVVPKGTTYNIKLKSKKAWFLIIESKWPIVFPSHYINKAGQAHMSAPVVETEIEAPVLMGPIDKRGKFVVYVKHNSGRVTKTVLGHHPFDLAGWEGALYPFGFDILNHHGIAREIHTAPPVHQTFQTGSVPNNGFSLCSFVPQIEGWNPKEVPAPYAHFNVDSDECMFFCNSSYGARKGFIQEGSLTFHPGSTPHSPQGKAALRSLASRGTMSKRLAVMFDTYFESLKVTETGWKYRDKKYILSWDERNFANDKGKGSYESPSE